MAESSSMVNRQLLFDADGDTPVPAAEVLVGLKRGINNSQGRFLSSGIVSPHKRKNHTHYKTTNHKRTLRRFEETESDKEEAEDCIDSPPYKRSKRIYQQTHQQVESTNDESWKRPIRTFLRLPKALSWCRYEWFCSDINRLFLEGEHDFSQCLSEMFPYLKSRSLSVCQWRIIKRMIGKPRRCSKVFFTEERTQLARKRNRVRDIQRKIHQGTLSLTDFNHIHDIPDNIPTVLTVGTRVTAFLNIEKDKGFHTGTVEAVDLDNNQYWITFDKSDIGKHSIADTDVQAILPSEFISLSSLKDAHSNRQLITAPQQQTHSSYNNLTPDASNRIDEVPDPLLPSSPLVSRARTTDEQQQTDKQQQQQQILGGFPTNLLRQVVEMSKLLGLKQDRVRRISLLNKEAEKMHARHVPLTQHFQKHYATTVIDLDDINRQLNLRSEAVKKYCTELGYEDEQYQLSNSQECLHHAQEIIASSNERLMATRSEVTDDGTLALISKLTSLLLQIELISQQGRSQNLSGLQNSINETLQFIHTDNHKVFQKHIETPLALIQSGMNPSDNLHPFSVTIKPVRTSYNYSPRRLK